MPSFGAVNVIVWDIETVPDLRGFAAANDIAGREITHRQERPFKGLRTLGLGTFSMTAASGLVTAFALVTAISPDPW